MKESTMPTEDKNEIGNENAIHDPSAAFSPTIQDEHLAPGVAIAAKEDAEKKRPKVTVMCSTPSGIIMQLYSMPTEEEQKALPPDISIGYRQELHSGANPGIDKAFFEFWKNQNRNLGVVANGMITAQDEKEPEQDEPAGASWASGEHDDKKD